MEGHARRRRSSRRSRPQLEKIWLNELPIVPLFIGPRWSTYSTKYFHCFATPKNFYGDPIFTTFPDNILSFTRICPGGQAGGVDRQGSRPPRRAGSRLRPPRLLSEERMRWFLRRLVFYVFAIWVALTLNFLLPRLMPGEPDRRRCSST